MRATSAGWVLPARSGGTSQPMLGLTSTRWPFFTKAFIPPSSWMPRSNMAAGSPFFTATRSGVPGAASARPGLPSAREAPASAVAPRN